MIYTVRRSIDSIEELERIERKEVEAESARASTDRPSSVSSNPLPEDFTLD